MISLKIETLLEGKTVEQNRVEYKRGWNPKEVIHTICAFANDYSNVNGGYIVIGIDAKNGIPVLPPMGVSTNDADKIQLEIFEYCNRIEPRYIPSIEVINYPDENTQLVYLKCSPGDCGPYQAPIDVYSKDKEKQDKTMRYWIRPASLTAEARQDEIAELYEKFNSVPFDDRVNRNATLNCIERRYVEDFLKNSNSALFDERNSRSLEDILLSLEVANETDTGIELRNIAILMFADHPEKYIPGAYIELIRFHDDEAEGSDNFTEKMFYGPIWKQVHDVLDYINNNVIAEEVVKVNGKAEANRFFNYPFNALEEAVVNAIFHKSYRDDVPVNIRIYNDRIEIINYPGPDKWIDMDKFSKGLIRSRKYRNRRIGEMFKEIDLSEKQGTGITKIIRELDKNGSPKPEFETVDDRVYLTTIIKKHASENIVKSNISQNEGSFDGSLTDVLKKVFDEKDYKRYLPLLIYYESNETLTKKKAMEILKKSDSTALRYMNALVDKGIVEPVGETNNLVYRLIFSVNKNLQNKT